MKKILITGFEPFGGDDRNPSGEAVEQLIVSNTEYEVKKLILPVTWRTAFPKIREVWDVWHPDAVLMVGLAAGSKTLRIERVGINLCGATKDNDGVYANGTEEPMEMPIVSGAEDGYFTTYNEKAISEALAAAEIPAKYSYSAGAYICNYLLYSSLHKCKKENADMKIGFIHLPYAEGQREDVPSLPLETMVKALGITLDHLWE